MRATNRITVFLAVTAITIFFAALSAPGASAMPCYMGVDGPICPPTVTMRTVEYYASDLPNYKGWATIRSNMGMGTACSSLDLTCTPTSTMLPVTAWKWTSAGWVKRSLNDGTRVYAWPYGAGWEWVWTSTTGWLAVRADRVFIRSETVSCIVNGINTCPQPL